MNCSNMGIAAYVVAVGLLVVQSAAFKDRHLFGRFKDGRTFLCSISFKTSLSINSDPNRWSLTIY